MDGHFGGFPGPWGPNQKSASFLEFRKNIEIGCFIDENHSSTTILRNLLGTMHHPLNPNCAPLKPDWPPLNHDCCLTLLNVNMQLPFCFSGYRWLGSDNNHPSKVRNNEVHDGNPVYQVFFKDFYCVVCIIYHCS